MTFDFKRVEELAAADDMAKLVPTLIEGALEGGRVVYDHIKISSLDAPEGQSRVELGLRSAVAVRVIHAFFLSCAFTEDLKIQLHGLFEAVTKRRGGWTVDIPKSNEFTVRFAHGSTEQLDGRAATSRGQSPLISPSSLPVSSYGAGGISSRRR